ncbi:unnamed protein product [Phaedon cochleariae]|uniref:USP domain-containing protein n=1 Tax=Phaedon cochleariae TaxID=80249 RepID=A0A9N9S934_PHACE|nr:unnamed protein product [Phaedon cochleariae]
MESTPSLHLFLTPYLPTTLPPYHPTTLPPPTPSYPLLPPPTHIKYLLSFHYFNKTDILVKAAIRRAASVLPNIKNYEDKTVQSLLDYYFKPGKLTEDNQCYCEMCSRLTIREHLTEMMKTPSRLIFSLILFRYDPSSHQSIKMQHFVCLIINSWICRLHAVVVHCGSNVESSHYYTISKDKND